MYLDGENVNTETGEITPASSSSPRENSHFSMVYDGGFDRLESLAGKPEQKIYLYLAKHISPNCGAVVADQAFLAEKMGVHRVTLNRWLSNLEKAGALVRIKVSGNVCAYALDPTEVWRGYHSAKDYAAFTTKTIVNKDNEVRAKLKSMFSPAQKASLSEKEKQEFYGQVDMLKS